MHTFTVTMPNPKQIIRDAIAQAAADLGTEIDPAHVVQVTVGDTVDLYVFTEDGRSRRPTEAERDAATEATSARLA